MSNAAEKAAVKRGVRFLDKADKGWEDCVDLETFNILSPCRCVIGQVYVEPFIIALRELRILGIASRLGFVFGPRTGIKALQEEWKKAIKAKQVHD